MAEEGAPLDVAEERQHRLFAAARAGVPEQVGVALDDGAVANKQDPWGLAAVHSASIGGHAEVVALLLSRSASIDLPNAGGKTPLHIAASGGHMEVVELLLRNKADVLARTPYGSAALDLAREHLPGGPCERLIIQDLKRRLDEADEVERDLQRRLASSGALLRDLRFSLGKELAAAKARVEAQEHSGEGPPALPPPPSHGGTYWEVLGHKVNQLRRQAEDALSRAYVRELPAGFEDTFPWSGDLVSTAVLPVMDPADRELCESYYKLQLSVEYSKRMDQGRRTPLVDAGRKEVDRLMEEATGRTMQGWEELVDTLHRDDATWDWSRLEVRDVEAADLPGYVGPTPTVYAVAPEGADEGPVFRQNEVVGPLGGTVRRRDRYENRYYPKGLWLLHDPMAYEYRIHPNTAEMRAEPLVLDLVEGASANRLRHLADARPDPMNLRAAEEGPLPAGVFAPEDLALPRRKYGMAMPRVRSRPSSAHHGDGGDEALAVAQAAAGEADAEVAAHTAEAEGAEATARLAAEAAANVKLVEVQIHEWPYVFVVATRDIQAGENLLVDRGEEHWAIQRGRLARLRAMSRVARDMVVGVDVDTDRTKIPQHQQQAVVEEGLHLQPRRPMRRVATGAAAHAVEEN